MRTTKTASSVYVTCLWLGSLAGAGALHAQVSHLDLIAVDANLRPVLKAGGFLTRDPRMKERKKYGQPGARKRFQYSKR